MNKVVYCMNIAANCSCLVQSVSNPVHFLLLFILGMNKVRVTLFLTSHMLRTPGIRFVMFL